MGTRFAFEADKSFVVGKVEELLTGDVAFGASSIVVDTTVMQDGGAALTAGEYVLRDNGGTAGTPNAEIITVATVGTLGVSCTLTLTGSVTLAAGYKAAKGASILTPGHEMKLVSADFNARLRAVSCTPKWEEDDSNSKYATGDHGEDESIAGTRSGEISFSDKIAVGSVSDLSTLPTWAKFMRGVGLQILQYIDVCTGGKGVEFFPIAAIDNTTLTIWHIYKENAAVPRGMAICFAGCSGTGDIGAAGIGKPYMFNGKFTGKYARTADVSAANMLVLTSPETTLPEKMLNNSLAINFGSANTLQISQWKLDLGNEIQPLINQADTTGYDYYSIVTRKPRFTCDPIQKLIANEDFDSEVTNETTGTIVLRSAPSTPHVTINIPNAQLITPAMAAREGYVAQNRTYRCLRNVNSALSLPVEPAWSMLLGARS